MTLNKSETIEKRINNIESFIFWLLITTVSIFSIILKKVTSPWYILFLLVLMLSGYLIVSYRFMYICVMIGERWGFGIGFFIEKHIMSIKRYGPGILLIIGVLLVKYYFNYEWKIILGAAFLKIIIEYGYKLYIKEKK